uniref:Venom protein n=1 Tax=Ampulex compressa TaxID=860918 RepID=A0A1W6EW72_AMPCP|nr:venom protein [Ampulex compressa]
MCQRTHFKSVLLSSALDLEQILINMKYFVLFAILLLVYSSQQTPFFFNCPVSITSDPNYLDHCLYIKCHNDGHISAVACATSNCISGDELYRKKGNLTKVYPECCSTLICRKRKGG